MFERIWPLRSQQPRDNASLLAHDDGFCSAVATREEAAIALLVAVGLAILPIGERILRRLLFIAGGLNALQA